MRRILSTEYWSKINNCGSLHTDYSDNYYGPITYSLVSILDPVLFDRVSDGVQNKRNPYFIYGTGGLTSKSYK